MSLLRWSIVWVGMFGCQTEGSGTGDTGGATVDCTGLDWNTVGAPFVFTYCTGCHSTTTDDRGGAPPTVNLNTYEGVTEWLDRIEVRAVELRNMPPTGGPPESELLPFGDWISCGAPE